MSALTVVTVPVASLALDPSNVRAHGEKNLAAIRASLETFGQRRPLVCARDRDGALVVIAGNGTLEAARSLGWERIEVTVVPDDWDADKARAYAIADNRTAELAEWNERTLAEQLLSLEDSGVALTALGFDAAPARPAERAATERDETDLNLYALWFTDDELETVRAAFAAAKLAGPYPPGNTNRNGNALTRICEARL